MDLIKLAVKNTFFIIRVFLIITISFYSCNKCIDWGHSEPDETIRITDSLLLYNDTITYNDTLWLGTTFSDSLIRWDSVRIHYHDYELNYIVRINPLDGNSIYEPLSIVKKGRYDIGVSGGGGIVYFKSQNNTYEYKIGFLFNRTGRYMIQTSNGWGRKPNGCDSEIFEIVPFLKVKQRNLYLLSKDQLNLYDTTTIAAFVVK